jgi:hypothetical protein
MSKFKLTKENDPRCIEYYIKAFPHLSRSEQTRLKDNWIAKNVKSLLTKS